jgi:hypothetical protein
VHPGIRTLLSASRPPRPLSWDETLAQFAAPAIVAETQHATDRAQYAGLNDSLAMISLKPLVNQIKPHALSDVSALLVAGKDLRASLDSDLQDLRDAVRDAAARPHSRRSPPPSSAA